MFVNAYLACGHQGPSPAHLAPPPGFWASPAAAMAAGVGDPAFPPNHHPVFSISNTDSNKRSASSSFFISDILYPALIPMPRTPPSHVPARRSPSSGCGRTTSPGDGGETRRSPGRSNLEGRPAEVMNTTPVKVASSQLKFGIERLLAKTPASSGKETTGERAELVEAVRGGPGFCPCSAAAGPDSPSPGVVYSPYLCGPHPYTHPHTQHPGRYHGPGGSHHSSPPRSDLPSGYRSSEFPGPYAILSRESRQAAQNQVVQQTGNGKRKRSWSRAVFSHLQRKGLEKRFEVQKYVTKPDRRQLANMLGLTDAQVKVWFQNRRMKWRHAEEAKRKKEEEEKQKLSQTEFDPKSDSQSDRPIGRTPMSDAQSDRPIGRTPMSDAQTDRPIGRTSMSDARSDRPIGRTPKSDAESDRPIGRTPRSDISHDSDDSDIDVQSDSHSVISTTETDFNNQIETI